MEKPLFILGLMSGTSLDGLDMALCKFNKNSGAYEFEIQAACTISYTPEMSQMLAATINDPAPMLFKKNKEYGQWLGEQASAFLVSNNLPCQLIASHGHTIHHRPEEGFTFQLGAGQIIANTAKIPVISDFRSIDISLGGQGAPLVPIGDLLLFPQYDYCLNLGGISNISIKTPEGITAYDLGIANILLNYLAQQLGLEFDKGGAIAAEGKLDTTLFEALNNLDFYQQIPPKSLGVEFFNLHIRPLLQASNLTNKDFLHTAVHHIAFQVAKAIPTTQGKHKKMLISGGGAKNDFLVACIAEYCREKVRVQKPSALLLDFKEALIFAFMAWLHLNNKNNCLKSVTGATKDSIGGYYYKPL